MIDLQQARAAMAAATTEVLIPVTGRWLEQVLSEIESGRAAAAQLAARGQAPAGDARA